VHRISEPLELALCSGGSIIFKKKLSKKTRKKLKKILECYKIKKYFNTSKKKNSTCGDILPAFLTLARPYIEGVRVGPEVSVLEGVDGAVAVGKDASVLV
jgi:hypothetical protein